jgi:BexC/CtrB/KpsE family polysaccharide export inner-membrane protein
MFHAAIGGNAPVSSLSSLVRRVRGVDRLFLFSVVLPTLASTLYFGAIASDVYVSESRFIVRSPDKPAASGVGLLLKSAAGFSTAGDEIYAAQNFVNSRDALRAVDKGGAFRTAYTQAGISLFDRFDPLGISGSFEELYEYYLGKVTAVQDTESSIITLTVKAYSPRDAQHINQRLLDMAEATVNRLNERARSDLIRTSSKEVAEAKLRAQSAALALSAFRNREGVVDPEKQATVQIQMVSKLQDELIATQSRLAQLRSVAPSNPQISVLQAQANSLSAAIDAEIGKVAGDRRSLSSRAAQYQRLQLESQFADRQLAVAMASQQDAENEARRKQAYVERIVEPNLADYPIEPRRIRGVLSTFVFALIVWGVLSMMLAGVREHGQ